MTPLLYYLIPPLIGALIGWSTNKLAIWMLFNPKNELRIFGVRFPFTPGLIPRDQARIASRLGSLVEEKLIDPEELDKTITKDKVEKKIEELMNKTLEKNLGKLVLLVPPTTLHQMKKTLAPRVSAIVKEEPLGFIRLINFGEIVEEKVAHFPLDELEEAIKGVTSKHLTYITLLGGVLGFTIGLIQAVMNSIL